MPDKMHLALVAAQSYFRRMKRIVYFFAACLLLHARACLASAGRMIHATAAAAAVASKQEAEENYNTLKGHVDELIAAQEDMQKHLQALSKEIADLRAEMSKPSGNYASQDDLKALSQALQEMDKKREADKDLILKEMEKLAKAVSAPPPSHGNPRPPPSESGTSTPNVDQNGYYYTIKRDDTLSLIAQAYREQGIRVSTKQIVDANPNVNPAKLVSRNEDFHPCAQRQRAQAHQKPIAYASACSRWHTLFGCFFAPLLLFYVLTGWYQTVYHDRLKSPGDAETLGEKLRTVHVDQIYPTNREVSHPSYPKLFQAMVVIMAIALVTTSPARNFSGISVHTRKQWTDLGFTFAWYILVPMALLWLWASSVRK